MNKEQHRGKPPCPCCGEEYDRFVWKSDVEAGNAIEPSSECETGLGWYLHDG